MAWQDPASPTSVYLAKPGESFQVEVYDPSPRTALKSPSRQSSRPFPTDSLRSGVWSIDREAGRDPARRPLLPRRGGVGATGSGTS